ncbi:capsule biosynthesis GfcC family protein [Sinimarinibacterium flocculans]|nr:capsule biosynthesis GfcC family protein [Sinimarinibacterium flocculans]
MRPLFARSRRCALEARTEVAIENLIVKRMVSVGCVLAVSLAASAGAEHNIVIPHNFRVEVRGAVMRPGPATLASADAHFDRGVEQLGGPLEGAYRFAAMILRLDEAHPVSLPCLSPSALHAAQLLQDDPTLTSERNVIEALLAGRMQRVLAAERPFGRLGTDRGREAKLQSGDVLALPGRSQRVYVVLADGRAEALDHRAEWTVKDYLDALPAHELASRRQYLLHYPDGQAAELALSAWNRTPSAVPPGSMLAPRNVCLPVAD